MLEVCFIEVGLVKLFERFLEIESRRGGLRRVGEIKKVLLERGGFRVSLFLKEAFRLC